MHASIWTFKGDPDDLAQRFDALLAETPTDDFIALLVLRAPDGIVIVDTCPSREAFEAFATGGAFHAALRQHGLPEPAELRDYPVHIAFTRGTSPAVR